MLKHSVLVTRGLAQSGPRTFTLTQERGRALASTSWEAIHSGARDEGHDARTPLRTRGFSSDERDAKCTTSEIVRHKAQLTQVSLPPFFPAPADSQTSTERCRASDSVPGVEDRQSCDSPCLRTCLQAERAAGGAARARAEAKAVQYLRQQAKREVSEASTHTSPPPFDVMWRCFRLPRPTDSRIVVRFTTVRGDGFALSQMEAVEEAPEEVGTLRPPWEEPPPEFGLVQISLRHLCRVAGAWSGGGGSSLIRAWPSPRPPLQAAVAERSIREAMRKGAFENLTGKGKPLKLEEDHTSQARGGCGESFARTARPHCPSSVLKQQPARPFCVRQFYSVDSGQAVVNKILKNANYRPASIELRDELAKALEGR